MGNARNDLIAILEETRAFVAKSGNDFAWSSWESCEDALAELDAHIARVAARDKSKRADLRLLFAPTGDLQELALNSGWAVEYLALAARFDRVESV